MPTDIIQDKHTYLIASKMPRSALSLNPVHPLNEYAIIIFVSYFSFHAPEGTSGGILKSHRPSVRPSVRQCPSVTNRVSVIAHKLLNQI